MSEELNPFEFIKAVSKTKKDLIRDSDQPDFAEKQYNGYMVNRGLSYFQDTILHANEMNMRHHTFNDAQFRYYLGSLRPRDRFSKWHKAEKNDKLDVIQHVYECNRTLAKQYAKILSDEDIKAMKDKMVKGG